MGLLATVLCAIAITVPSLWGDEAVTVGVTARSVPDMFRLLGHVDAVHGLYYLLMHGVFDVFGYTPLILRLPSALAAGVAAAGVVVLGRMVSTERVAIIAGLVFCVLPRVTWMGGEGRSYALTAAAAVWLTVALLVGSRRNTRSAWIVYGVLAWVSVVLFIYLALLLVVHGVAIALSRKNLRPWGITVGAVLVAASPVIAYAATERSQIAWLPSPGLHTVYDVLVSQWFMSGRAIAVAAWVLLAIGVVHLIRRRDATLTLLLGALVLPTAVMVAASFVTPLYNARYFTFATPFLAILIAIGIAAVRWRGFAYLAIAALVVLAAPGYLSQRSPSGKHTEWAQAAERIEVARAADPPGSATGFVFGTYTYTYTNEVATAYPAAFTNATDIGFVESAAAAAEFFDRQQPLADSISRLDRVDVTYLLTEDTRSVYAGDRATLEAQGWTPTDVWVYLDLRIERWER